MSKKANLKHRQAIFKTKEKDMFSGGGNGNIWSFESDKVVPKDNKTEGFIRFLLKRVRNWNTYPKKWRKDHKNFVTWLTASHSLQRFQRSKGTVLSPTPRIPQRVLELCGPTTVDPPIIHCLPFPFTLPHSTLTVGFFWLFIW